MSSICGGTTRVVKRTAAASQRSIANSWATLGPAPIQVSASFVAFPTLILNYAGQAAVARRPSVVSAASKLINTHSRQARNWQ